MVNTEKCPRSEPVTSHELAQLIQTIAATHDRAAFAQLFEHFAPRVKAYMIRLGANAGTAEDLAQETMLLVWRKADYFDPAKAGAATWVFTIARNLRIDVLRQEHHPNVCLDDILAPEDPAPLADAVVSAAEQENLLKSALKTLPKEQAEVIELSFFAGKPHAEIEKDLGIPLGTVKSRLRLAMIRLRTLLAEIS